MNHLKAAKTPLPGAFTKPQQTETRQDSRRHRHGCQACARLPDNFTSKGFEYILERRRGSAAIYRQRWLKGSAEAFEVVIPRIANRRFIQGKWQESEPYEIYPGAEQWSRFGWTFTDLDRAVRKLDLISPRLVTNAVLLNRKQPKVEILEQSKPCPKLAECDHNVINNI
jgi:hypothetical protein